eukprot:CAMPEP_0114269952 /NCGR_PEP_ID=MMETSP0058-20121206/26947_1 /TAXON_ID=36894 /ORGANISM="Pyramimonas parkeae, CCMP726" /LENGTH=65 /DNA_ID=CAMNT_0001388593 /DNA_START=675 /DNA_END=869 /DNA_ORIENTATION=-
MDTLGVSHAVCSGGPRWGGDRVEPSHTTGRQMDVDDELILGVQSECYVLLWRLSTPQAPRIAPRR